MLAMIIQKTAPIIFNARPCWWRRLIVHFLWITQIIIVVPISEIKLIVYSTNIYCCFKYWILLLYWRSGVLTHNLWPSPCLWFCFLIFLQWACWWSMLWIINKTSSHQFSVDSCSWRRWVCPGTGRSLSQARSSSHLADQHTPMRWSSR